MRRRLVLLIGWTAATAAVVTLGWAAVSAVASTITEPPPLALPPTATSGPAAADETTVAGDPAPTVTGEAAPPATAPATRSAPEERGEVRTFDLVGGTVGVRSSATTVNLVYATPRAGFTVDVRSRGASRVDVRFSSDGHESRFRYDPVDGQRVEERPD